MAIMRITQNIGKSSMMVLAEPVRFPFPRPVSHSVVTFDWTVGVRASPTIVSRKTLISPAKFFLFDMLCRCGLKVYN